MALITEPPPADVPAELAQVEALAAGMVPAKTRLGPGKIVFWC